ncbi:recombinase family protein [Bacteroidota bacterium]
MQGCKKEVATLLIAKLDRISRDISFIFSQNDSGVHFQSLDLPEAKAITLGIMAALAQLESELISTGAKTTLQAMKERGPGWKPGTLEKLFHPAQVRARWIRSSEIIN